MSLLQPGYSKIGSNSTNNSTKLKLSKNGSLALFETNLRHYFNKVLENPSHLLITSGVKSKKTLNTSRRKYKTRLLTCNTSNLSW